MGSGKLIKQAIEKNGHDRFRREILKFYENEQSASDGEAEYVTEEIVKDPMSYNLCLGGGLPPVGMMAGRTRPDARIRMIERNPVHMPGVLEKLKGNVTVKDLEGNIFSIKTNDPRYISGELVSVNKGRGGRWSKGKTLRTVQCPHCEKIGGVTAMGRWHFDHCRMK